MASRQPLADSFDHDIEIGFSPLNRGSGAEQRHDNRFTLGPSDVRLAVSVILKRRLDGAY